MRIKERPSSPCSIQVSAQNASGGHSHKRGARVKCKLDESANTDGGPRISRAGSRTSAWVLPTNEELMIALHTRAALAVTA
jgi:acetate kinase